MSHVQASIIHYLPINDGMTNGRIIIFNIERNNFPMNCTYMASLAEKGSSRNLSSNPSTIPLITPPKVASVRAFSFSDFLAFNFDIPILELDS